MSINIGPADSDDMRPRITVIGVGGAGGNAIANMIDSEIEGVEFVVANTDAQALSSSPAEIRIQLGTDITKGLGAGAKPEVGRAAAEETVKDCEEALEGVNMVFIAAGMGGGTGTGAAPVIAETARKMGVLTVGVVTKPFLFAGTRRMPGLINLDFADVRSVMSEIGKAMMGTGEAEGENRAKDAAEQAIANPLLDGVSMQGAKGVIISIIGGEDMKLFEVDGAANHIRNLVDEDANIIWGSAFNPDLDGKIRVSVVATGIEQEAGSVAPSPSVAAAAPAALTTSRAPQRPVHDLADEAQVPEESPASNETPNPPVQPAPFTLTPPDIVADDSDPAPEPVVEDQPEEDGVAEPDAAEDTSESASALFSAPVAEAQESDEDESHEDAKPFDLTGMQAGDDMGEHEGDDVDEIVDPLAGLRGAEEEPFDLTGSEAPEADDDAARSDPSGAVYS